MADTETVRSGGSWLGVHHNSSDDVEVVHRHDSLGPAERGGYGSPPGRGFALISTSSMMP